MSFLKKVWPFVLAGVIVSICIFVFGRFNKPLDSIKVYKTVTPTPKAEKNTVAGDTQTLETPAPQPDDINDNSTVSERHFTDDSLDIENIDSIEDIDSITVNKSDDSDVLEPQDLSVSPELSDQEIERQKLLQRRAEAREQMRTIAPEGVRIRGSENPELVREILQLHEEIVRIDHALSNTHDHSLDELLTVNRTAMFVLDNVLPEMTPDGKMPISTAEKMVSVWEQEGNFQAVNRMRLVIQNAMNRGDILLERNHLEAFE